MKNFFLLGLLTGGIYFVYHHFKHKRINTRKRFIDNFHIPKSIGAKVLEAYPHLSSEQVSEVLRALKVYFHLCNQADKRFVSMPSQVVDVAWHEFILFTRQYQLFCQKAFGRFLHHVPAEAMSTPTMAQEGIRRAWRLSCKKESISPSSPTRLPLLFAIDAKLHISNGFFYSTHCQGANASSSSTGGYTYCAGDIGCGGVSCGSGCSSGCGSSCGSGCGGD